MHGKGAIEVVQTGDFSHSDLLHLQEVIEACDIGLCLLNSERCVIAWNPYLSDLTGKTHEQALNEPLESLIPQLAGPRFSNMVGTALQASQSDAPVKTGFTPSSLRHLFNLEANRYIRVSVKPLMMHQGYCLVQLNEVDAMMAQEERLTHNATVDQRTREFAQAQNYYGREIGFYRDLADDVGIPVPQCYFGAHDPETQDFALLLEDLHPARTTDQQAGGSGRVT